MKTIILIGALLAPPLLLASPTVADAHAGHTSCRDFGQLVASEAQAKVLADEMRSLTPGTVDDVVRVIHLGGQLDGEEVPAFCTT